MSRPKFVRLNQLQKSTRQNITAATATLGELHQGDRRLVRLNKAGGQALLLPYATGKGGTYRLFVETTYTSSTTIKVAQTNNPITAAADVIYGGVGVTGTTAGTFAATANGTITFNGSTTGGLKGSYIELEDADAGVWRVAGMVLGSGTAATPFS
jgi:hypothetical protein